MTASLIVNPVAGSDAGIELLPRIEERLRRTFGALDVTVTGSPADAESAGGCCPPPPKPPAPVAKNTVRPSRDRKKPDTFWLPRVS